MSHYGHQFNLVRHIGIMVFITTLLSACSGDNAGTDSQVIRPVRTAIVTAEASTIQRTYPAVVLPAQQAELAFKVSGKVIELPIRASSQVKKGDVIAKLEQREFESKVEQLESQLGQANAQLTALESGARAEDIAAFKAKVKAAKAQLETQRTQVKRLKTLADKGTIARVDYEQERAKLAADQTNVDVAEQELKKAQTGARAEEVEAQKAVIRGLETQLSEAKANLADTTLRAPFDGVIASRNIENLTNIQANTTVAVIQQLDAIDLQFDVPGVDVSKFGQEKEIVSRASLDVAPGQEFETQLVEFATQADPATQTFRGRVSISYPDNLTVLPGMTGHISVTAIQSEDKRLTVPESALASEPDGSAYIWLVNQSDNSVSKHKVIPEILNEDRVSISGDVKEGSVVVTAGVSFLREGMIVKPISSEKE